MWLFDGHAQSYVMRVGGDAADRHHPLIVDARFDERAGFWRHQHISCDIDVLTAGG